MSIFISIIQRFTFNFCTFLQYATEYVFVIIQIAIVLNILTGGRYFLEVKSRQNKTMDWFLRKLLCSFALQDNLLCVYSFSPEGQM